MIGIEIDGKKADLKPDTSITLTLVNPLFNDDNVIPGDYSMPFTMPGPEKSPLNAEIFGQHDVVESTAGFRKKNAKLFFDGVFLKSGKIWNRQASGDISSNFTFGLSQIKEDFKTKRLREIMNEEIVISDDDVSKEIYVAPFLTDLVGDITLKLKINNREYTSSTFSGVDVQLVEMETAINADITEPRATAEFIHDVAGDYFEAGTFMLKITPYSNPTDLASPLVVDFDQENDPGYFWQMKVFDMTSYWAAFNTFFESYMTGAPATDKFRIPLRFNAYKNSTPFFSGQEFFTSNYSSTYLDGLRFNSVIPQLTGGPFRVQNFNSLQPFVMVKYIFQKAADYFNLTIETDWLDDADTQQMLLDNEAPLNLNVPFIGKSEFVFWKQSFNLADLVPDITFVDMLKAFQNRYNLKVNYNDTTNTLRIMRRKSMAESTVRVNIDSAARGVPAIQDQSLTGIRFESTQDKSDLLSVPDFVEIDTPELTVKSELSGLTEATQFGLTATAKKIQPVTDFPIRVFYYKGIDGQGIPYARANAEEYEENWPDLYDKFWKRWAWQRTRRKEVEIELDWGMGEFNALNLESKFQYDRNDYFIASLEMTMTMQAIKPIKATLYRL